MCYTHWVLWVDFEIANDQFKLTKHELLTLMAPFNNYFPADECPLEGGDVLLERALRKLNFSNASHVNLNIIASKLAKKYTDTSDRTVTIETNRDHPILFRCENDRLFTSFEKRLTFMTLWLIRATRCCQKQNFPPMNKTGCWPTFQNRRICIPWKSTTKMSAMFGWTINPMRSRKINLHVGLDMKCLMSGKFQYEPVVTNVSLEVKIFGTNVKFLLEADNSSLLRYLYANPGLTCGKDGKKDSKFRLLNRLVTKHNINFDKLAENSKIDDNCPKINVEVVQESVT